MYFFFQYFHDYWCFFFMSTSFIQIHSFEHFALFCPISVVYQFINDNLKKLFHKAALYPQSLCNGKLFSIDEISSQEILLVTTN